MALINYSDSESESEAPPPAPKPQPAKPAFQKVVDRSKPGKIKVDLPSLKADPREFNFGEPSAKRARIDGTFSGFNNLLPPPKRRAQSSLKPGLSLKTSGEAAFIRKELGTDGGDVSNDGSVDRDPVNGAAAEMLAPPTEPKLIGKATRFVPLSVTNRKKKQQQQTPQLNNTLHESSRPTSTTRLQAPAGDAAQINMSDGEQPRLKPKRSLFIASQEDELPTLEHKTEAYEPLLETESPAATISDTRPQSGPLIPSGVDKPTSLEAIASDLHLTAAQRRQLFGRNAKGASVAHFNMEAEYAANEELRKAGEVVQHRAVKSIAPGKHSLQQLVNNAKSQKDAMEDAWAEGRKNRGEGGSKYGWG